jgi:glycosyltransferase involved in cell wall biosynthesis
MISVVMHVGPGIVDYTIQLANALSEGARVGLSISEDMMDMFSSAISSHVTPLIFKRPRRRDMRGFGEMNRLSRTIQKFQPDVFHLQGDGLWESVLMRMINPIPSINTIHDPIKHIDQRNLLNNSLMRDAVQRSRGWVVHSEGFKSIFLNQFKVNPDLVLVHPHGIIDHYTHLVSGNIQKEKYILFFGSIRVNKGCDILLRSFYSVKNELGEWKLIIAGSGDGLKSSEYLLDNLGSQVDYRGYLIPAIETADLFSRAGIVALPYRHGTQSGVLTIAASFGCPVVSTRFGCMSELVQDRQQVLFVDSDNESSLAQGLLELAVDDVLRVELGRNLKKFAQIAWSWAAISERSLQFYEKILSLN